MTWAIPPSVSATSAGWPYFCAYRPRAIHLLFPPRPYLVIPSANHQNPGINGSIAAIGNGGYRLETIRAPATVLATGGLGDLYAHTSNPASAKGAGFAMALRAGAMLSGMEYVQFHPTTLHIPGQRSFLLTEALRGEGAKLVDRRGRCFARNYHPDGEVSNYATATVCTHFYGGGCRASI